MDGSKRAAPLNDVVFDILSVLPASSLLRLRCVSKQWRGVIESPIFAEAHASRAAGETALLLFLAHPTRRVTSVYAAREDGSALRPSAEPIAQFEQESCNFSLEGSCNGLIHFVRRADASACLLNLAARRRGRDVEVLRPPRTTTTSFSPSHDAYGLGFDDSTRAFKLVHVFYRGSDPELVPGLGSCGFGAELHVLGTDSWRGIPSVPRAFLHGRPVFAGGAVYWADMRKSITYFEVGKEEFGSMGLPVETSLFHLVDLRGRLAMVDVSSRAGIGIWVMKKVPGEEQMEWAQEYRIKMNAPMGAIHNGRIRVLGLWKRSEILMMGNNEFFSYDAKGDRLRYIHNVQGLDTIGVHNESLQIYCHTESLMLLFRFQANLSLSK